MTITARHPGRCPICGTPILVGDTVAWTKGRPAEHIACAIARVTPSQFAGEDEVDGGYEEPDVCGEGHQYNPVRGQRGCPRCNNDYAQGVADGNRYHSDRMIYGEALAERFAMDDELAAYNRGED